MPDSSMWRVLRSGKSLTLRLLSAALLWMALALTVGGFVLSAAFRNYVVSDFDDTLNQTIDTLIGVSYIDPDGRLTQSRALVDQKFQEPYSGHYFQISVRDAPPQRSRSLWDQALDPHWEVDAKQPRFMSIAGPDDQRLRAAVRDARLPDTDQTFRFIAAGDIAEISGDIRRFNSLITWSLSGLGAGLALTILVQVLFGLRPLSRISKGLGQIRTGQAKRLDEGFPREVQPLVTELNALLDHNERIVDRARTHAGNLAHALKTPLSVLSAEAQTEQTPLAEIVERQTDTMRRHIDHHLKRARATGGGLGDATAIGKPLADLVRVMQKLNQERDLSLDLQAEQDLVFAGTRQDFDEIVGNLLDNACKWAKSRIEIRADRVKGQRREMLRIDVADDGSGVPADELDSLFERGKRLDESVPGTGLGLAIVRDIVELNGGEVQLGRAELGGLRATVRLPAVISL